MLTNINSRIKRLRKIHGMTQQEFGEKIGIGKSALSQIESGISNPSKQTILAICRVFQVNKVWLLSGQGEEFVTPETFDLQALIQEQGLEGREAQTVKKLVRMYCSLSISTRQEIMRQFDVFFGGDAEPRNVHDWTREEMDAEYKRQMDAEADDREKGTTEPPTGSLNVSGADCA